MPVKYFPCFRGGLLPPPALPGLHTRIPAQNATHVYRMPVHPTDDLFSFRPDHTHRSNSKHIFMHCCNDVDAANGELSVQGRTCGGLTNRGGVT